jgi:hypothetical protein
MALRASCPSVSGAGIEQPVVGTSWALSNNLHQYILYAALEIKRQNSTPTQTQSIIAIELSGIHHIFFTLVL